MTDLAPGGPRYDILVAPGNKGPESSVGPSFQFEDVNVGDLNVEGNSALIRAGDRFRFVAKVGEFNPTGCLLLREPVATRVR